MDLPKPIWLFVINPKSGPANSDFEHQIKQYLEGEHLEIRFFHLKDWIQPDQLRKEIEYHQPERVVAVGGDGTLKLLAESILGLNFSFGIIPVGSANGLANELGISGPISHALEILKTGNQRSIHLTRVNDEICIHLADIGLNAFLVKKFEQTRRRGMVGYFFAAIKTFWSRYRMQLELSMDDEKVQLHAFMLVVANATRYGTGAWINPIGNLGDHFFEVVVIRRISFWEGIKLAFGSKAWQPRVIRVFQTNQLFLKSRRPVHFQVDGEYRGKISRLEATIIPDALKVFVP